MSEHMSFDVVIVGGGPAGLSAAIRLKQLATEKQRALSVCVLEKGAEIGAHILSGAVLNPRALHTLLPGWQSDPELPSITPVLKDRFYFLTKTGAWKLPTPPQMQNEGNFIITLGSLCQWLAKKAEALGVDIFPGFAATTPLFDTTGKVHGVKTGDMGRDKDGNATPVFQPGVEIYAQQLLLAEGCRGSLTKQLITHFGLERQPQTYGLGLKEVWRVQPEKSKPGTVIHTVGWPIPSDTYGGSFIYHRNDATVALGVVVGLDYPNPYLSPYDELQRFKTHPLVADLLAGGERIGYGARALNEGGFQSIPRLTFPGGALIGCSAGFMNVAQIKGIHTAMQSAIVAAEATFDALQKGAENTYEVRLRQSWVWKELYAVRNIRPAFRWGLVPGLVNAALETYVLRGRAPWTLSHRADHASLKPTHRCQVIHYPKPDGKFMYDKLTSVMLTNTMHRHGEPCHLILKDPDAAPLLNWQHYAAPEQRYCPAGVYEVVHEEKGPRLQINAQNCIHCKTCDIKDPTQNITWVPPEGGGGPHYGGGM